jgi:hypothetical protein
MYLIRRPQIERLRGSFIEGFHRELASYLMERYPVEAQVLGEPGMRSVASRTVQEARACGLDLSGEVARYAVLAVCFGSAFGRDPQLPWAAEALAGGESEVQGARRIDSLFAAASRWLRDTAGPQGGHYRAALLQNYRRKPGDLEAQACAAGPQGGRAWLLEVYPHKARQMHPELLDGVIGRGAAAADRHGLRSLAAARVYAALAFMMGSGFDDDPLYPWAPDLLARAAAREAREQGAALLEGAIEQIGVYLRAGIGE